MGEFIAETASLSHDCACPHLEVPPVVYHCSPVETSPTQSPSAFGHLTAQLPASPHADLSTSAHGISPEVLTAVDCCRSRLVSLSASLL